MKKQHFNSILAHCANSLIALLFFFLFFPAQSKAQSGLPGTKPKPTLSKPRPNSGGSLSKPTTRPTGNPAEPKRPTTTSAWNTIKRHSFGYNEGDHLLNIGVGLSSYYNGLPIGFSYESGIHPDISVGAQFDYNSGNYNDYYGYYYNGYRWGYNAYYLGIRGSYHFNRLLNINDSKIDLYAGVGLGYQHFQWRDRGYGYGYAYGSGLFFNYFIGGKYYFTNKVGAFVELGYSGLSSSRVGLAVKF